MIVVVFLLPPFLLVSVVLLGRYEDRMLTAAEKPRHARGHRHLRLVSSRSAVEPARPAKSAVSRAVSRNPDRRDAA
ncbi:hypothetical protein [Streptomyces flavovirens]